jgi:peroxiredoxin
MSPMHRRRWLMGAAALAAAGAGAGLAWWQGQRAGLSPAEAAFWASRYQSPTGETLAMSAFRGRPLLLNFWATWCPPCVEELPLINSFYREQRARGWQVLGLAVDQAEPVRRFVRTLPLDFPLAMAGMVGIETSQGLGNASGSLPYSVVFGPDGDVLHRKLGRVSPEELAAWAQMV